MRSALAGAASNIVVVKIAAAVPMSVILRMFYLLLLTRDNDFLTQAVPTTDACEMPRYL